MGQLQTPSSNGIEEVFSICSFMSRESSISVFLDNLKGVSFVFLISFIIEDIYTLNANNVDPDQTPRSVTSDLGLYCLPMSLF